MRHLNLLAGMAALALVAGPAAGSGPATLNKCIDARGKVTYSNLPCRNARETRAIEIDPAPPAAPVRAAPVETQAMPAAVQPPPVQSAPLVQPAPAVAVPVQRPPAPPRAAPASREPATLKLETRSVPAKPVARTSARQCDALTDKLGRVFDTMDAARRKGYTQEQMNAWNQEIKDLERKKQQAGCF
jgi:hypothetical protein